VDSSVAAALLQQQGYDVVGMMMRLWSESGREDDNRCCTPDAMAQARRVAARLGVPFYAIDAQQPFYEQVVTSFIDQHLQGRTPNPCLECNRHIRWEFLLNQALSIGADYMATGHYVRLQRREGLEGVVIRKAVDERKDQSYVLHVLGQEQLRHALFPLGELTKPEVRQLAHQFGLAVAERPDSQDLCFLGSEDYRAFLARNAPAVENPGPIINAQGQEVGRHNGLAFYTIGQRKGLGLAGGPWYVLKKEISRNALVVGEQGELGRQELHTGVVNWVSGAPPAARFRAEIKIRYKALPAAAWVETRESGTIQATFDRPMRDITPGQAAVIYQDEICLGGGIIQP
jgi:tRNA-specific 2-thiouridylase